MTRPAGPTEGNCDREATNASGARSCARTTGTSFKKAAAATDAEPRTASPHEPSAPPDSVPQLEAASSFKPWPSTDGRSSQAAPSVAGKANGKRPPTARDQQDEFDYWAELGDRIGRRGFADDESNEEAARKLVVTGEIPLPGLRTLLVTDVNGRELDDPPGRGIVVVETPLHAEALKHECSVRVDFAFAPWVPPFASSSFLQRTRATRALRKTPKLPDADLAVVSMSRAATASRRLPRLVEGLARRLRPNGRLAIYVPYGKTQPSVPTPQDFEPDAQERFRFVRGGEIHFFRRRIDGQKQRRLPDRPPHGVADLGAAVHEVLSRWLRNRRIERLERLESDLKRRELLSGPLRRDLRRLRREARTPHAPPLIARLAESLRPLVGAAYGRFKTGRYSPLSPKVFYLLKPRFHASSPIEAHRLPGDAWSGLDECARARYRPITVYRPVDRLVLGVIAVDLTRRLEPFLSGSCVGGRQGWSVRRTVSDVQRAVRGCDGRAHWTVVDVAAFFDSIPHDRLYALLDNVLPEPDAVGLKALLGPSTDRGLPQGAPISPILANAYLARQFDAPLLRWLHQTPPRVRFWRYLDDILIVGASEGAVRSAAEHARWLLETAAGVEVSKKFPPRAHAGATRPIEYLGLRIEPHRITLTEQAVADVRALLASELVPASSKRGLLDYYLSILDSGFFASSFGAAEASSRSSPFGAPSEVSENDALSAELSSLADPSPASQLLQTSLPPTDGSDRDAEFDPLLWACQRNGFLLDDPPLSLSVGHSAAAAEAACAPRGAAKCDVRARIDHSTSVARPLSVRSVSPELDGLLDLRAGSVVLIVGKDMEVARITCQLVHAMKRGGPSAQTGSKSGRGIAFFGAPPGFNHFDPFGADSPDNRKFDYEPVDEDWLCGVGDVAPFLEGSPFYNGWFFGCACPPEIGYAKPPFALQVTRYAHSMELVKPPTRVTPCYRLLGACGPWIISAVAEGVYDTVIFELSSLSFDKSRLPQYEKRDAVRSLLMACDRCERDHGFRPTVFLANCSMAEDLTTGDDVASDERFYADFAHAIIAVSRERDRIRGGHFAQLGSPLRMCDHWTFDVFLPRSGRRRSVHASQVLYETESRRGRSGTLEGEWDWRGRAIDLLGWRDRLPEGFAALPLAERRRALEAAPQLWRLRARLPTAPPTPQGLRTLHASIPGLLEAGLNRKAGDTYAMQIADRFGGYVQPNSGAGRAKGDVRTSTAVFEAKHTSKSSFVLGFQTLRKLLEDRNEETKRSRLQQADPENLRAVLRPVLAIHLAATGCEFFLTTTDDPEVARFAKNLTGESIRISNDAPPPASFRVGHTGNVVWESVTLEELTSLLG